MKNLYLQGILTAEFLHSNIFYLLIGLGVVILLVFIITLLVKKSRKTSFFLKKDILSSKEKDIYSLIYQEIKEEYILIPHVELSSVVGMKHKAEKVDLNQNIDFVVMNLNFQPLTFINVKGLPERPKRNAKDYKQLDLICKKTGATFVELNAKKDLTASDIIKDVVFFVKTAEKQIEGEKKYK